MLEHFTEALVLENETNKEFDARITLYTRDLGKVVAKAKSARKTTSKLNGHLQPLNFVNARLIEKNGFQIVDSLTNNYVQNNDLIPRLSASSQCLSVLLRVAQFINEMTFEARQDLRLWQAIKKIFSPAGETLDEKIIYRGLLKILGFALEYAVCANCHKDEAVFFDKESHIFLCSRCGQNGLKIAGNKLLSI